MPMEWAITLAALGLNEQKGPVKTTNELPTKFSVFFAYNSASIDDPGQKEIKEAVNILKTNKDIKIDLIGNADKTGNELYNDILSKRRAQAVFDVLVKEYNIDPSRLNIIAKGSKEPISKNMLYENRRVDMVMKK